MNTRTRTATTSTAVTGLVDAKGDLLVGSAADTLARLAVGNDGETAVADTNSTNGLRFSRMGFSLIRSGGYSYPAGTTSTSNQTVNRLLYLPFIVPRRKTFDRIAVNHTGTTGGVGSVARLGIYANATNGDDKPGELVLDAGTVDTTTAAAFKPITISQALDPGLYWLCCVSQWATTNPVFTTLVTPTLAAPDINGLTTGAFFESSVTGALPSTATPATNAATSAPVVFLRAA